MVGAGRDIQHESTHFYLVLKSPHTTPLNGDHTSFHCVPINMLRLPRGIAHPTRERLVNVCGVQDRTLITETYFQEQPTGSSLFPCCL